MVTLSDLEDAYLAASVGGMPHELEIFLHRQTGRTVMRSFGDWVEEGMNDEALDSDPDWVRVSGQFDLHLGRGLALEFAESRLPEQYDKVERIFSRAGAFGRFKEILDGIGQLQAWYDFEKQQVRAALLAWAKDADIAVEMLEP